MQILVEVDGSYEWVLTVRPVFNCPRACPSGSDVTTSSVRVIWTLDTSVDNDARMFYSDARRSVSLSVCSPSSGLPKSSTPSFF